MCSSCYNILMKMARKKLSDPKDIKLIINIIFEVDSGHLCYLELFFRE